VFDRSKRGEHALLIQPHAGKLEEDVLEEFTDLARSAGASIAATLTARIDRPNPSILIGSGKLDEVKAAADATGADLILVNHALSPVQERNLERFLERRVIDRTGLILDIFAQRAHSHEGKLQVELAQLRHLATRLVRGWTHLERQRGGAIGLRGPGETQLETDRRLLQKRVEQLQKRLEKVEVQRTQSPAPRAAPCARAQRTAARGPGRLYQCRQVDPVQRADRCRGLRRRPAVCDPGPDRAAYRHSRRQRGAGRHRRFRARPAARTGGRVPLHAVRSA